MKTQKFGQPEVSLSWIIEEDDYSVRTNQTTLSTEKGKMQLVNTILMLIDQGKEIRIGTDSCCLILEANEAANEYTDSSYQYVDDDHDVMLRGEMPDGTYNYFFDDECYKDALDEFLKDHPYYKKNDYGRWYDEREQKLFEESMNK